MVGALCCLFCYSKEKEDAPTGATFNKTFVTGYLTPESIVISKMNSGIKITFKGDLITSGRSFDALSIYYNDLSYNRYTIDGPRTAINDSAGCHVSRLCIHTLVGGKEHLFIE